MTMNYCSSSDTINVYFFLKIAEVLNVEVTASSIVLFPQLVLFHLKRKNVPDLCFKPLKPQHLENVKV